MTRFKSAWLFALGLLGFALWAGVSQKARERAARAGALPGCLDAGVPSVECERRLDENSAKCFLLTYTPGSRRQGRAESFDEAGYRDCAASPSAQQWGDERGRQHREETQRERDAHQQMLNPP